MTRRAATLPFVSDLETLRATLRTSRPGSTSPAGARGPGPLRRSGFLSAASALRRLPEEGSGPGWGPALRRGAAQVASLRPWGGPRGDGGVSPWDPRVHKGRPGVLSSYAGERLSGTGRCLSFGDPRQPHPWVFCDTDLAYRGSG